MTLLKYWNTTNKEYVKVAKKFDEFNSKKTKITSVDFSSLIKCLIDDDNHIDIHEDTLMEYIEYVNNLLDKIHANNCPISESVQTMLFIKGFVLSPKNNPIISLRQINNIINTRQVDCFSEYVILNATTERYMPIIKYITCNAAPGGIRRLVRSDNFLVKINNLITEGKISQSEIIKNKIIAYCNIVDLVCDVCKDNNNPNHVINKSKYYSRVIFSFINGNLDAKYKLFKMIMSYFKTGDVVNDYELDIYALIDIRLHVSGITDDIFKNVVLCNKSETELRNIIMYICQSEIDYTIIERHTVEVILKKINNVSSDIISDIINDSVSNKNRSVIHYDVLYVLLNYDKINNITPDIYQNIAVFSIGYFIAISNYVTSDISKNLEMLVIVLNNKIILNEKFYDELIYNACFRSDSTCNILNVYIELISLYDPSSSAIIKLQHFVKSLEKQNFDHSVISNKTYQSAKSKKDKHKLTTNQLYSMIKYGSYSELFEIKDILEERFEFECLKILMNKETSSDSFVSCIDTVLNLSKYKPTQFEILNISKKSMRNYLFYKFHGDDQQKVSDTTNVVTVCDTNDDAPLKINKNDAPLKIKKSAKLDNKTKLTKSNKKN